MMKLNRRERNNDPISFRCLEMKLKYFTPSAESVHHGSVVSFTYSWAPLFVRLMTFPNDPPEELDDTDWYDELRRIPALRRGGVLLGDSFSFW